MGAEAASVSVLGELRGPGAVPAHGDGLHLHAAGHTSRGAGVEVRPVGWVPAPGCPLQKGSLATSAACVVEVGVTGAVFRPLKIRTCP